jgi:hypothetical protein
LTQVKEFREAVLDYIGAEKINIISHSIGVTLARAALKGRLINTTDEPVNLGALFTDKINTFVFFILICRNMRCKCICIGIIVHISVMTSIVYIHVLYFKLLFLKYSII